MPVSAALPRFSAAAPLRAAGRERDDRGRRAVTARLAPALLRAVFGVLLLSAPAMAQDSMAQDNPAAAPAESVAPDANGAHPAPARAIAAPAAIIELFTSQGCSSCPPADKLLGELAQKQPDVLVLSLSVDYWDYLGWKDTLAKHGHSLRQKAYAKKRGDSKMFTPQVVVNGSAMAIGSDEGGIARALAKAPRPTVPVRVENRGGTLHVTVGTAAGGAVPGGLAPGEVWLCPVASRMDVEITRGENAGNHVIYHNVVRGWVKLGDWDGTSASYETPLKIPPEFKADQVAVIVQSGSFNEPGPIVGATLAPLH